MKEQAQPKAHPTKTTVLETKESDTTDTRRVYGRDGQVIQSPDLQNSVMDLMHRGAFRHRQLQARKIQRLQMSNKDEQVGTLGVKLPRSHGLVKDSVSHASFQSTHHGSCYDDGNRDIVSSSTVFSESSSYSEL